MNLQEELKALKERIAELEEQAKKEDEFPQLGDEYWYIDEFGTVWSYEVGYYFTKRIIEDMKNISNVFKTKKQAEFAAEKLKVEAELRKHSRPFDCERYNHFFKLHHDGTIEVYFDKAFQIQGTIYFESGEKAIEAIKSVGEERIKKYIFGVED